MGRTLVVDAHKLKGSARQFAPVRTKRPMSLEEIYTSYSDAVRNALELLNTCDDRDEARSLLHLLGQMVPAAKALHDRTQMLKELDTMRTELMEVRKEMGLRKVA
jgi:Arc/MetJ-type ribon-helix-helix transcriptional regulator